MSEINEFEGWRVPPEFVSDGCTWAPDKLLRVDLKPACVWHDWARRQLVPFTDMTIEEADAHFYRYLIKQGLWRPVGRVYWNMVKFARRFYKSRMPQQNVRRQYYVRDFWKN